jgi:hypothetical protein
MGRWVKVPYPAWLHILAWFYIVLCMACCVWMIVSEVRNPQKMWIMDVVWPVTGLYLGPLGVWLYYRTLPHMQASSKQKRYAQQVQSSEDPDGVQVSVAVCHCGAGCTLGDIIGEIAVPILGLVFAGEFGSKLIIDFLLAYLLGVMFQYFTIAPMRGLSFGQGLKAAVRADTVSIGLFEVGMFAWMALSQFVFFPAPHLRPSEAAFWFMMQMAMVTGFLTAFPANRWLLRKGWKEKMPQYDQSQRDFGTQIGRQSRAA